MPKSWISAVIVPLYKDTSKGEWAECINYRDISFLSVVGKVHALLLLDRVLRVTEGLTDEDDFRARTGCLDQIFTLKQIVEKA